MGTLEQAARQKRTRVVIGQAIIAVLATTAAIGLAVAAPNATQLLRHVDFGFLGKRDPRLRVSEAMSRLRRKGLVEWVQGKGKWHLRLTAKGRQHAARYLFRNASIPHPRRWDGRWRFVMFDIPERQRPLRRRVRLTVEQLGFYRFQDSVWVFPYDCEEIIAMLKLEFGTGNHVRYLVADAVEYDTPLRKHFGLSRR